MSSAKLVAKRVWILKNARKNQKARIRRRERKRRQAVGFSKPRLFHSPEKKNPESLTMVIPETLNFVTDYESTCGFFAKLREALNTKKLDVLHLDHRTQKAITPEAALLLIAELSRSHLKRPNLKKQCNGPAEPTVCWILQEVGYFRYFPGLKYRVQPQPRHCLQALSDRMTRGPAVKQLIQFFENRVMFTPEGRKALYNALIEAMDNVAKHAYPNRKYNRRAYSDWWLVGYVDDEIHEISFSFFDQGIGIPKSIRTRIGDDFRKGTALIRDAVEHGRSSTKLDTRGKGLPSLKKFVDDSIAGTLVINSFESQCVFESGKAPREQTWGTRLPGTLISWNIQITPAKASA